MEGDELVTLSFLVAAVVPPLGTTYSSSSSLVSINLRLVGLTYARPSPSALVWVLLLSVVTSPIPIIVPERNWKSNG